MIIGITGTNAAGKESVAAALKKKGFVQFSCSDVIRDEARSRGLALERDVLIALGNELRATLGPSVLADRVFQSIKEQGIKNAIVVSIRNPAEAQALAAHDEFVLVWVDALPRLRYDRSRLRLRDKSDELSFDEFLALEQLEQDAGPTGQRLKFMKELASIKMENNGTVLELEQKIVVLLDSLAENILKSLKTT